MQISLHSLLGILLTICVGCPGSGSIVEDNILPNHLGRFNFDELESSIYSVVVSAAPVAEEVPVETLDNVDNPVESKSTAKNGNVVMVSNRGQRFACIIPALPVDTSPSEKDGLEPLEKFPNVSEILSPLSERACLIKTVGWWTYEYCHGKFVRQYHVEAGQEVGKTFYLGYYRNETVWTEEKIQVLNESKEKLRSGEVNSQAFHSVYYENGTECDLTGKPRRTEVKIMCDVVGLDRLADIQEVDSCSYVLLVYSSLLCDVSYFKREQLEETQVITCSPLVSKEKYEAYLERKRQDEIEARARADMERSQSEEDLLASFKGVLPRIEEDSSTQTLGDADERTHLLHQLLTLMVPDITEREMEEQLLLLRKKFKGLNNDFLKELAKKLDQEKVNTEKDKEPSGGGLRSVMENTKPKEVEGVVEAETGEEEDVVAELEVDDESLSSLEQAVTNEVKEKLSELGLPTDGVEVKLKVTTLELEDDTKEELESDQESADSIASEETADQEEKKKKSEIKVIRLTLLTDSSSNSESRARKRELEAKEKAKMSYLEQAYNFVWDKKQEEQRRRKQSL